MALVCCGMIAVVSRVYLTDIFFEFSAWLKQRALGLEIYQWPRCSLENQRWWAYLNIFDRLKETFLADSSRDHDSVWSDLRYHRHTGSILDIFQGPNNRQAVIFTQVKHFRFSNWPVLQNEQNTEEALDVHCDSGNSSDFCTDTTPPFVLCEAREVILVCCLVYASKDLTHTSRMPLHFTMSKIYVNTMRTCSKYV